MKAVLIVSHGSRSSKTREEVEKLANALRQKVDNTIFEYAFLEIEHPSIPEGIDACVRQGVTEVVVLLNFLNAGKHVDGDIPQIIKTARQKHRDVKFRVTKPVGQHEEITKLFLDMI